MADRSGNRKRKGTSVLDILNGENVCTDTHLLNDGRISVKTPTGKIISLEVKGSDTIGSIKLKMQAQEFIPSEEQELILNGMVLEDMNTVSNLCIKNTALILVRKSFMNIYIKNLEGKIICSLDVNPMDTIASLKAKVKIKEGISADEQVLIFNKMVLGDGDTLLDFHIKSKAVLTLIRKSRGVFMKIFIKTLTGETFTEEVKPSYTIHNLKTKIQDKVHISCEEQELIYNKMVLHNINILADYNIKRESTLTVMHSSRLIHELRSLVRIFIKPPSGMTFNIDVKLSDTICNVKTKILDNAHIHQVDIPCDKPELIFNEMVLHDNDTLYDYNIKRESTLTLVPISSLVMQIFIKIHAGRTITLEVKPTDTICDVKSKIFNKEGYPLVHQRLIFNKHLLSDDTTVADYHIHKESTLHLFTR